MFAILLATTIGIGVSTVSFYDGGQRTSKREASPQERQEFMGVRYLTREARSLGVPDSMMTVDRLAFLAGLTRTREIRSAQWTVGNCYNIDHWPAISVNEGRYKELGRLLSELNPTLARSGSYWDATRRIWVLGDGQPIAFVPITPGIIGSFEPDQRIELPQPYNRTEAVLRLLELRRRMRQ